MSSKVPDLVQMVAGEMRPESASPNPQSLLATSGGPTTQIVRDLTGPGINYSSSMNPSFNDGAGAIDNHMFDTQSATSGTACTSAINSQQQFSYTAPVEIDGPFAQQPTITRKHQCKVCQSDFGRNDTLARHMREVHGDNGEKRFFCDFNICKNSKKGFGFARQEHLDRHLKACRAKRFHRGACTAVSHARQTHQRRIEIDVSNPQVARAPKDKFSSMDLSVQETLTKTLSAEKQWLLTVRREYDTRSQSISQQIAHIDAILRANLLLDLQNEAQHRPG